jgi:hypothetical protein
MKSSLKKLSTTHHFNQKGQLVDNITKEIAEEDIHRIFFEEYVEAFGCEFEEYRLFEFIESNIEAFEKKFKENWNVKALGSKLTDIIYRDFWKRIERIAEAEQCDEDAEYDIIEQDHFTSRATVKFTKLYSYSIN